MTSSTTSTATPPKLNEEQLNLDLGDFGTMFKGFDKRASTATVREEEPKNMPPRSLTSNRISAGHLVPPQTNGTAPQSQQPQPHSPSSYDSERSSDGLLNNERSPQPPPHSSSYDQKSPRPSEVAQDENEALLKQTVAASKSLEASSSGAQSGRYRGDEDSGQQGEDDNMFDNTFIKTTRAAQRYAAQPPSPPRNKVMTPAQFEKFKQEKERTATQTKNKTAASKDDDDDEDDDYEDDEDEVEKSKQAAKQRRKQEAHMAVYRQQMMKVTGESAPTPPPRQLLTTPAPAGRGGNTTDGSDEDEEIPLAILAAHGFPAKNRAPSRLSTVGSNPNLRASMTATPPPQPSRASTLAIGEHPGQAAGSRSSQLPAFARRLPQDPFVGAGLVRNPARESIAMGGGAPPAPPGSVPPGGLVGVIANEERSRALRRGTAHFTDGKLINSVNGTPGVGMDPMTGMSPPMMHGMGNSSMPHLGGMGFQQQPSLTPGDQAQIQMTQQMTQFMQMQMQFMQMMAGNQNQGAGGARPNSFMGTSPMGDMPSRQSFVGSDYQAEPRPQMNDHMRTMSMVQPSSGSWIQPTPGYAPSIRAQGEGYAPSIAPSERSNIGLPGRYRPVSHAPTAAEPMKRASTMTGALGSWDDPQKSKTGPSPAPPAKNGNQSDDDDDEEGWMAMKEKREKKRSLWKSKKGFGKELSALIL